MKTLHPRESQLAALSRPADVQSVLRLFAAGNSPQNPERLRYLTRPHYRVLNARPVTLAGDGRVFLWAHGRVPGFTDYTVPPGNDCYVDVAAVVNQWRAGFWEPLPGPAGAWRGTVLDTVWAMQTPARVRRYDLARLQLLDGVEHCGCGPVQTGGHITGWRALSLRWRHGTATGGGVILCPQTGLKTNASTLPPKGAQ